MAETASPAALALSGVERTFTQGEGKIEVLRGVDLVLQAGEIVALVGPSGAGKSTLLQIAGLLERPDRGDVVIAGRSANALDDAERTDLRRRYLGFVYQFHHLLPEFSALENVMLPQMFNGIKPREARRRSEELLLMVGMAARAGHRPAKLSGGEQQRIAIARALANAPRLLLADEPTGNLDPETASAVFSQLLKLVRATGLAALIATHNYDLARQMDRTLRLDRGLLQAV